MPTRPSSASSFPYSSFCTLSNPSLPYAIRWKQLRLDKSELKRILGIGLPTALQSAITSFSNVFVQSYINLLGSSAMAGWTGYNTVCPFVQLPLQSISLASSTFVGQNYGAGKYKRARQGVGTSLLLSEIITAVLGVFVMVFAVQIMSMLSPDPEVIQYGAMFIRIITPFYLCSCVNQVYAGALRGIGKSITPTIIMLSSFVAFRQLFMFCNKLLFAESPFYVYGVSLAYPSGWILCSILLIIFYRRSVLFRTPVGAEEQ